MTIEIAVLTSMDKHTVSIFTPCTLKVYQCANPEPNEINDWKISKERPFDLAQTAGLTGIRQYLAQFIQELGACKVLVGSDISGIPFNILTVAGFHIFEISDSPESFLDYVFTEVSLNIASANKDVKPAGTSCDALTDVRTDAKDGETDLHTSATNTVPIPNPCKPTGYYVMDLKNIHSANPPITSKQALLPFLKKAVFYELEVRANHVPPWFERDLPSLDMEYRIISKGFNDFLITINKKMCQ